MRQIPIPAPAAPQRRSARRAALVGTALVPALLVASGLTFAAGVVPVSDAPDPTDRSAEHRCAAGLDAAVATARRGALDAARDELLALGRECKALPQIEHDLGVIALRRGDGAAAVRHLERALELDERTARTVRALREVRRWRAAAAWRDALGESGTSGDRGRPAPALELLDSAVPDAFGRLEAARDALLRDEAVVGYELYEWWQTLRLGDADALASHYAHDASRPADEGLAADLPADLPEWDDVDGEVAFTERDAVALLRWDEGGARAGRLLLLRAVEDRWLIYRETPL